MKQPPLQLAATLLVFLALSASAAVHYVDVNGASPTPPYTSWATAAVSIQDAIDLANPGDDILVTNGVYQIGGRVVFGAMTNRVVADKPVTVQSVNGPAATVIKGYSVSGSTAVRCVYLTNGALLAGFTLTNGTTRGDGDVIHENFGGGVWCEDSTAIVSNCLLIGNSALLGGGAHSGTLNNCVLSGNSAKSGGGANDSALNGCLLTNNTAGSGGGGGGGANGGTLNNCTLVNNYGGGYGGGGARYSVLVNCLIIGNGAGSSGGGALESTLTNCTIVGNGALEGGGGAGYCTLNNCIVYENSDNSYGSTLNYCCTTPLPEDGVGNFTNEPAFLDVMNGDFHLQDGSPCVNAGHNNDVTTAVDLDGNPRIVGGTVDVGAYEFQSPGSILSYAWAQQYGLPTDGSADLTDDDGDGLNNWNEWRCDTNPTNVVSVLRLLDPTIGAPGLVVRWESVSTRTYFLERGTNLGTQPLFLPIGSNITGQASMTTYPDTNAVGSGPFFYRVAVQE